MNKIKGILITGLLLLSILLVVSPASAGTININPGEDIEAIIEGAPAGSTIYVNAGTYLLTGNIDINQDNITLIGAGATSTILDGQNISSDYEIIYAEKMNVSISGFTFRNSPGYGIFFSNYVTGTAFDNIFTGNDEGIAVVTGSTPIIKNNLIFYNNAQGIEVTGSTSGGGDPTIINNTIVWNGGQGIVINLGNATIKNNIIAFNQNNGIELNPATPTVATATMTYNDLWSNSNNYYDGTALDFPPGAGNISADPIFVDGTDTFYLENGSPCVDSGSEPSAVLGLQDGYTTRTDERWDTGTVDMGYHYASNWVGKRGLPIDFILKILKGNKNK